MSFLQNFLKTVTDRALADVILRGEKLSLQERKDLQEMLSSFAGGQVVLQGGRTDARLFNRAGEQIYLALQYLFNLYDELERVMADHYSLLDSQLADVRRGLKWAEEVYRPVEFPALVIEEDLRSPRFLGEGVHVDPDGQKYGKEARAALSYGLTLSPYVSRNYIQGNSGRSLAELKAVRYIGMPLPQLGAPVENAIDGKVSIWQETVWVPAPLDIAPGIVYSAGVDDVALYGNSRGGAFCELYLDFKYPQLVSEFILFPAAPYPVELVSLVLYEQYGGTWHKVAGNVKLEGTQVIRFPAVSCVQARFLLRQQHYERRTYFLSTELLNELFLEQSVQTKPWRPEIEDVEERNYLEQYPGWEALFTPLLKPGKVNYPVCEYVYGLREIEAYEKQYRDVSVMITEPFPVYGEARAVELETDEEHPKVMLNNSEVQATSIEYYLGCDGEWFPIQPVGKEVVGERLWGPVTTLRFPVASNLRLYRNGLPYDNYTMADNTVNINNYDGYSIYTASYVPAAEAYVLNLSAVVQPREYVRGGQRGEYFEATDSSGKITLSYLPFLNWGELVRWRELSSVDVPRVLESTGTSPLQVFVEQNGSFVEFANVTDYVHGTEVTPGDGQFVQRGRDVIFNGPINTPIIVYYKYLGGEIRLKAVLRRVLRGHSSLTCVLKGYRLKFYRG